jgi:hypothetical protein
MRDQLQTSLTRAREMLTEADWSDRMRHLAMGLYDDEQEALEGFEPHPRPVTEADLDEAIEALLPAARDVRAFVAQFGDLWPAHVRARWLTYADELEARYRSFKEDE